MNQPNARASSKLTWLWILLGVLLLGSIAVSVIGVVMLKRSGGLAAITNLGEGITPIDLTAFYDKSGSWDRGSEFAEVPRGPVTLAGVPFEVNGLLRLSGRSARNDNKPYRDEVKDIPVNKKFARLHMLHILSYSTSQETPYARVVLRYADGTSTMFPMIYGQHARDWHRSKYEYPSALGDPNSKVVWRGEYDSTPVNGKTLRIFKTMFTNPKPELEVASIDLYSENITPNATILALSVGPANLPRPADDTPSLPEPEAPYEGELRITAVDAESGKPLANVNLKVSGSEPGGSFRTPDFTTDASGVALVKHPGADTRSLTVAASRDGVAMKTARWRESEGEVIPVEFTMRLEKGVTIGGVVQDESGQPIANAKISVRRLLNPGESTFRDLPPFNEVTLDSDAQGRWEFRSLPANLSSISASVSHPDFVDAQFLSDGVDSRYVGGRFKFASALETNSVFTLRRGLTVTGRVLNEAGEPISGARLLLAEYRFGNNPPTARTDEKGAFRFAGAKEGNTFLTVQANGFAPQMQAVTVDAKTQPIEFKLAPGHTLKLRVVDEFDTPVRSARVSVDTWQQRQTLELTGSTDSRGRLTLDSAPADGMSGSIQKSGFMYLSGIQFKPGEEEQTFVLRRSLVISGDVVDEETRQPVQRFDVMRGQGQVYNNTIYWQLHDMARGSNGIFSLRMDQQSITALKIEADDYLPTVITLSTNGETHYTVALKKGSGPKGIVVQPNGDPAVGAQVAVSVPGRSLNIGAPNRLQRDDSSKQTDARGAFSLRPQVDGERIFFTHASGYAEAPFSNFVSGSTVKLEAWGVVEGVVTVANQPGTNQAVLLTPGNPTGRSSYWYDYAQYRVTTDDAGRFVISNAPPGERRLVRLVQTSENSWMHTQPTDVLVKPGEVVRADIGGNGHLVVGQLALSDSSITINWRRSGHHSLHSSPTPPPFKSPEEYRAWAESPETIEAQRKARHYGVQMGENGDFRIEEVLPGKYNLNFHVQEFDGQGRFSGRMIGSFSTNIVVPEFVKGTKPPPIDLGQFVVPVRQDHRVMPVRAENRP